MCAGSIELLSRLQWESIPLSGSARVLGQFGSGFVVVTVAVAVAPQRCRAGTACAGLESDR